MQVRLVAEGHISHQRARTSGPRKVQADALSSQTATAGARYVTNRPTLDDIMRKRTHRQIRRKLCPPLVALSVAKEVEIAERIALSAFWSGDAGAKDFNTLADVRDLLMLAASEADDATTVQVCDIAGDALLAIKARYRRTQRFGVTADERSTLSALVDVSCDFWAIQGPTLYLNANRALSKARGWQNQNQITKD